VGPLTHRAVAATPGSSRAQAAAGWIRSGRRKRGLPSAPGRAARQARRERVERFAFVLDAAGALARWLASWWAATGSLWLLGLLAPLLQARRGLRRLPRLEDVPPEDFADDARLPRLSVVVAARNEEASLEAALTSLLEADYPDLEVIAVDDRSTDATGAILDRLALRYPRLRVVHVRSLPPGWLGKNHALALGADLATGSWLLFTDADVSFSPTVLRRAVAFALRHGFDHVTAAPALLARGLWLRLFVAEFSLAISIWQQPWHAPRPDHRAAVGVGAFNLVRAAAYRATGGYRSLPLAVSDDLALGRVLKGAGFRQSLVVAGGLDAATARDARPFLQLQWYPTLRAAVRGLEKNAFAMFDFRAPRVVFWSVAGTLMAVGPLVAAFLAPGWHRLPWLLSLLLACLSFGTAGREILGRFPWPLSLFFPVAQVLLAWTVLRSAWVTLWRGGVSWRDTFYPLEQLRGAQVGPLRR
jgi:hypothetical protein